MRIYFHPRPAAAFSPRSGPRFGFTLIELSVSLVILSILAASALTVSSVVIGQQQLTGSKQRVQDAKKALTDYFSVNGRLPCPASRTAASGTSNFGVEVDCTASGGAPAGTARVNSGGAFTGAAYSAGVARIGALPVRTLGLNDSAMSDEYGNRLLYVMTERFANSTDVENAQGAITVQDGSGNNIATAVTDNAVVFAVFSTGPDGKGGSRYTTGVATPTSCSGGLDAENCDDDIVFRDTRFNNGSGTSAFYDDMLAWAPKYLITTNAYSLKAAGANGQVQYNSNGSLGGAAGFYWDVLNSRVGIGTSTPTRDLDILASRDGTMGIFVQNTSTGNNANASMTLYLNTTTFATHQVNNNTANPYYQLNTGTGVRNAYFDLPQDVSFRDSSISTAQERMFLLSTGSTAATANGSLTLNGALRLASKSTGVAYARGNSYISFAAPENMTASTTYTLPSGYGTNGQALTSDGAGVLYWRTPDVPLWQCNVSASGTAFGTVCFNTDNGSTCTRAFAAGAWSCNALTGWPGDGDWRCSVDMGSALTYLSCVNASDGQICTSANNSSWNCATPSGWPG